ncbi:LysR substrate-binding domain-containing protein [Amycolatopsis acidiphila]|uniref:LysR substrate-binding domain-containing protein n=1 Tax=Amycolatopsis acidiphila TaxID=715473 RepID=UPI001E2A6C0F|nr:LysR substrate-binding domain-containing protein [Amycolatopsis acidiphila]UIJ62454.1 LysR substrate-binding domain-containing protein [Amycolatopsis acidiphila]
MSAVRGQCDVLPANPRIGYSARQWPTRFGLVAAGLGIAVVPGLAADTVPADVVWLPVRDPAAWATREVRALSRESPSHAARAFLHALREQADSRPAARLPASGLGKAAMP